MPEVVNHAPWKWMQANGLPSTIPDDAHIDVDEQAGTITVEVWALTAEGGLQLHAGRALTTVATFPLVVPPPPGLMDAYRHTVARIRAERNAVAGIRQQAAAIIEEYLIAHGHPQAATLVWQALDLTPPLPYRPPVVAATTDKEPTP
jgi:hypothetical protein